MEPLEERELWASLFAPRRKESDSRQFTDSRTLLRRAFDADWEMARMEAFLEKEFQRRLATAKAHLPLAAILKGRRAAPPKQEPKK